MPTKKYIGKIIKTCACCNKNFFVFPYRADNAIYCSKSCANKSTKQIGELASNWKGGKVSLTCKYCSKAYSLHPSQAKTSLYCSESCRSKSIDNHGEKSNFWKGGTIEHKCLQCNKPFFTDKYRENTAKFCSQPCHDKWRAINKSGENSHAWLGGTAYAPYPFTFDKEFKRMIRERDNYTCAICKEYGKEVHHIDYNKINTVSENCITLCTVCHGKTNHNRSYWIEYFNCL